MQEDRNYCASCFLAYRTIIDKSKVFTKAFKPYFEPVPTKRTKISNSTELHASLKKQIEDKIKSGAKIALCLSGGIDSAILAKLVPKGTVAYTFKCVVPGIEVTDESPRAATYAKECGLEHRIIEIYWEDFEKFAPLLMKHKGAPIHSIEVQIYKAALRAKADGFDTILLGESADCIYGGLSNILSQDWTFGEFVDRYSYVLPYKALKNPVMDLTPFEKHEKNGYVDTHAVFGDLFFGESTNSYLNATKLAGVECFIPYANTVMSQPLDLERVRKGENKYLVREVFAKLYPGFVAPPKTPMPRPMNEWFKDWQGPTRPEFWPHCTDPMDGDQRWLVWCLEQYLNLVDEAEHGKK